MQANVSAANLAMVLLQEAEEWDLLGLGGTVVGGDTLRLPSPNLFLVITYISRQFCHFWKKWTVRLIFLVNLPEMSLPWTSALGVTISSNATEA